MSLILIDSVLRKGKNHYPQMFSEECKYAAVKENKKPKCITDNVETSSDEENSDKENFDEED